MLGWFSVRQAQRDIDEPSLSPLSQRETEDEEEEEEEEEGGFGMSQS